jgi:[ribosomal protein S5]-alanine N-acetyltransferase
VSTTARFGAIVTDRLILRLQIASDYRAWRAGFDNRLPSQSPYDEGWVDLSGCDAAWFAGLCDRHHQQAQSDYAYIYGIFTKADDRHLGNVDLSTIQREQKQWANLGYSLHNQDWGQGYATEAVRALIKAGFEDLGYHRIEAAIDLHNDRSIALAQRVGLQYECVRRGFYYEDARWVDHVIYAAVPEDFDLLAKSPVIGVD